MDENVFIKDGEFYIEDDGNSVVIGRNTAICGKTQLSCIEGTKIRIGTDCLFSSEIVLRTGDSHRKEKLNGREKGYEQSCNFETYKNNTKP